MMKGIPQEKRDQRWHKRHTDRLVRRKRIRALHLSQTWQNQKHTQSKTLQGLPMRSELISAPTPRKSEHLKSIGYLRAVLRALSAWISGLLGMKESNRFSIPLTT